MIIHLIIIPLLFVLGAASAAPVADNQTPSHILQKRRLTCSSFFGYYITADHCQAAIRLMRQMTTSTIHPGTRAIIPQVGSFSRINPDGHYRLPQRFNVGSCTILLDVIDPDEAITSSWTLLSTGAEAILRQCVRINGRGGQFQTMGFQTVVVNEANLDVALHPPYQCCINLIHAHQTMDAQTQCLLDSMVPHHSPTEDRNPTQ
ncbi:hypothetical protein MMC16_001310 [Acarospora aff. strigata]|nr:hypothetical protein [Acarospora aff. strigata]